MCWIHLWNNAFFQSFGRHKKLNHKLMYQINYYLFIFIWKIPVFDYPFQQVIGIGFFILRAAKKTRPPVSQYAANFNERKRFQMVSSGSSQFPHLPQTSREFVARFAPFIFSLFHSPLEHRKKPLLWRWPGSGVPRYYATQHFFGWPAVFGTC